MMNRPTAIIRRGFKAPVASSALAAGLALCLMCQAPASALASTNEAVGSVTITSTAENQNVVYRAYKLFQAQVDQEGAISYIAWESNDTRRAVVTAIQAFDETYADPDNDSESARKAAEFIQAHITDATGAVSRDSSLVLAADSFGMQLARAMANLSCAAALSPGESTQLTCGYYLFVTDSESIATGQSGTSPIFAVVGASGLHITEKTTVPTVSKCVLNEAGEEVLAVDAFCGQALTYKIRGTLPANIASFSSYRYVFTDTVPAGLAVDAASVAVTIDGNDCTSAFSVELADGALQIGTDNLLDITPITANSTVEVCYTAALNSQATLGQSGNDNSVHLTYGSSPTSQRSVSSLEKSVRTYAYQLKLHKQDRQAAARSLEGATFTLQVVEHANAGNRGKYVQADGSLGNEPYSFTTDSAGNFTVTGIDQGVYLLTETNPPATQDGTYQAVNQVNLKIESNIEELKDVDVSQQQLTLGATVTGDANVTIADAVTEEETVKGSGVDASTGTVSIVARDVKKSIMPQTGDNTAGIIIALVMIGAAGAYSIAVGRRHVGTLRIR